MNKNLLTIVLLGLLLIGLFSPFAVLSLLMLVLFGSAILWTGWTLLQTLLTGESPDRDPQQNG